MTAVQLSPGGLVFRKGVDRSKAQRAGGGFGDHRHGRVGEHGHGWSEASLFRSMPTANADGRGPGRGVGHPETSRRHPTFNLSDQARRPSQRVRRRADGSRDVKRRRSATPRNAVPSLSARLRSVRHCGSSLNSPTNTSLRWRLQRCSLFPDHADGERGGGVGGRKRLGWDASVGTLANRPQIRWRSAVGMHRGCCREKKIHGSAIHQPLVGDVISSCDRLHA